jgi:hypothetical protein
MDQLDLITLTAALLGIGRGAPPAVMVSEAIALYDEARKQLAEWNRAQSALAPEMADAELARRGGWGIKQPERRRLQLEPMHPTERRLHPHNYASDPRD